MKKILILGLLLWTTPVWAGGFSGGSVVDLSNLTLTDCLTLENGMTICESSDGIFTITSNGGTNNEDWSCDFETTANTVACNSSTGVTSYNIDSGAVFNDTGNDRNFRVESDNSANAFNVDGGTSEVWGDPFNDQRSYELAGQFLDVMTDPRLLLGWITPATTESDLSGKSHNATYEGSMTTTDQLPKGFVWSLDFDNSNDDLVIADHNDFSFGNGSTDSAFSCGGWVQVIDIASNDYIFSKSDFVTTTREWNLFLNSSEQVVLTMIDQSAGATNDLTTDSGVSQAWHFIVATYDGSNSATGATIYVDGVAVAATVTDNSGGTYVAMENLTNQLRIGATEALVADVPSNLWAGDMGIVFITAEELTSSDVWKLYVRTRGYYNL